MKGEKNEDQKIIKSLRIIPFTPIQRITATGGIQLNENVTNIKIHHNVFQDMVCSRYTGKGIYEDEDGASGSITVNNNLFYNCHVGKLLQKI